MLKIEQLQCFSTALREGSLTKAADTLNMSPSAVAYNIEALEDRLNTTLLIRKQARGVSATAEGKRLLFMAAPLLNDIDEIEQSFANKGRKLHGELVVGSQEGLSWSLIPRAIERITTKYPELRISQKTVFMDEGNAPVLSGAVDVLLTFVVNPPPEPGVDVEVLCNPNSYALMRAGHPLADNPDGVKLEELAKYPHVFILDGPAWNLFTGMYLDKGLTPNFDKVSNISTGAQAIVGRCDSVSLRVVKPAHEYSPLGDRLAYVPLSDSTRNATVVATCATRKHGRRPAKIEAFISTCNELFADGSMKDHFYY